MGRNFPTLNLSCSDKSSICFAPDCSCLYTCLCSNLPPFNSTAAAIASPFVSNIRKSHLLPLCLIISLYLFTSIIVNVLPFSPTSTRSSQFASAHFVVITEGHVDLISECMSVKFNSLVVDGFCDLDEDVLWYALTFGDRQFFCFGTGAVLAKGEEIGPN